jgi:hypothetical protein
MSKMMTTEAKPNPIFDGINAAFSFWEWAHGQRHNLNLENSHIWNAASDTISLHLPEEHRDYETVYLILRGTAFVAANKSGWDFDREKAFEETLLALSADPSTTYHELQPEVFEGEYSEIAKLHLFDLARLIVKHEI